MPRGGRKKKYSTEIQEKQQQNKWEKQCSPSHPHSFRIINTKVECLCKNPRTPFFLLSLQFSELCYSVGGVVHAETGRNPTEEGVRGKEEVEAHDRSQRRCVVKPPHGDALIPTAAQSNPLFPVCYLSNPKESYTHNLVFITQNIYPCFMLDSPDSQDLSIL